MTDIELIKAYQAGRLNETELLVEMGQRDLLNHRVWSRLNKDTVAKTYYSAEGDTPSFEQTYSKGTYVQVDKEDPSIYLDFNGDGFLVFNKEDFDEVLIDVQNPPPDWYEETAVFQG